MTIFTQLSKLRFSGYLNCANVDQPGRTRIYQDTGKANFKSWEAAKEDGVNYISGEKTILKEVDGWSPIIARIVCELGLTTAAVFGRIWRYCQLKDGVCRASARTIADNLKLSRKTIYTSIHELTREGYLKDLSPDLRGRAHVYLDTGKAKITEFAIDKQDFSLSGGVKNLHNPKITQQKGVKNLHTPVKKLPMYLYKNYRTPVKKLHISKTYRDSLRDSLRDTDGKKDEKTGREAWQTVMDLLHLEMPRSEFDRFLAPTKFVSQADGRFIVEARDPYAALWLNDRIGKAGGRLLAGILNNNIELRFIEAA